MISKYQNRISGPILDRIDIHLEVARVPIAKLAALDGGEPSHMIRARVEAARQVQQARFAALDKPNVLVNGDMGPDEVQRFCALEEAGRGLLRNAAAQMNLSARARSISVRWIWPRRCSTGRARWPSGEILRFA